MRERLTDAEKQRMGDRGRKRGREMERDRRKKRGGGEVATDYMTCV